MNPLSLTGAADMENWTVENFMIVGAGMLKMASFFWPIIIFVGICMFIELRNEARNEAR